MSADHLLAVEALARVLAKQFGGTWLGYRGVAERCLAAVLPEHRRQVLGDAIDAIEHEPFDLRVNDGTATAGWYLRPQTVTDAVRRLAAHAPDEDVS